MTPGWFFAPSFAVGHILPPLCGSDGRGDLKLTNPLGIYQVIRA